MRAFIEWAGAFFLGLPVWCVLLVVLWMLPSWIRRLCFHLATRRDRRAWHRMWQQTTYYVSEDWEKVR